MRVPAAEQQRYRAVTEQTGGLGLAVAVDFFPRRALPEGVLAKLGVDEVAVENPVGQVQFGQAWVAIKLQTDGGETDIAPLQRPLQSLLQAGGLRSTALTGRPPASRSSTA